ncbi:Signal recognition particle 19 kDa protein, partial [Trichinella papuae]
MYDRLTTDNEAKWACFYPVYINVKRTLSQGRRISLAKAVENPTSQEIYEILKNADFNVKLEKKMHPRESQRDLQFQGCVRFQLKHADGRPVNPDLPNRESVFVYAASLIPKLKSRQTRSNLPNQELAPTGKQARGKKKRGHR